MIWAICKFVLRFSMQLRRSCCFTRGLASMYPSGYIKPVNTLLRTDDAIAWLEKLRDRNGRAQIFRRLDRLALGHFGDCEPVGEGVSELRIDVGPGYRVYFIRRQLFSYVILTGGDKSTQKRDIERAKEIARSVRETKSG